MKTRHGFVSNSSSSSFIVIGTRDFEHPTNYIDSTYTVFENGTTDFGWDVTTYRGMDTRINFAWLQAKYNPSWMEMLEEVMKEHLGCSEIVEIDADGYIDHQSAACEGENTEMFETRETLARFLFSPDSCIEGGNDNQ